MNRHQANRIVVDGSIALRRHAIAYCAALCLPLLAELSIATQSTRGGEHFTGKAGNYIFSVCKIGGGASSSTSTPVTNCNSFIVFSVSCMLCAT
jgi:hypothetical protein